MRMAFQRKWVSDSNLDKLWHETVEKKEANKQRRSPDFCKEAILSATLKRISSEMIMRRISSPTLEDLEKSSVTLLSRVACDNGGEYDEGINITSDMNCDSFFDEEYNSTEKENTFPQSDGFSPDHESVDNDIDIALMQIGDLPSTLPESPKRKWSDSEDDLCLNISYNKVTSIASSPAKRQRRKQLPERRNSLRNKPVHNHKRSKSQTRTASVQVNINNAVVDPRETESVLTNKLAIPVKSVVNSISALSLSVGDGWEPGPTGSWFIPPNDATHDDPLELDDFFKKLKTVTKKMS